VARSNPALKLTTRSAATDAALLAAVLAAPDDDAPRLVYADFLIGRGDPRGELITVQLASKRTRTLAAREAALLAANKKQWAAPLGKFTFERGMASMWKIAVDKFPQYAEAVFSAEPIRTLDLSQGNALDPTGDLYHAFRRPELARLRRLELRRLRITVGEMPDLVESELLADLRELDLSYVPFSKTSFEALTQRAVFTKLEALHLEGCRIDPRFATGLCTAPFAGTLQHLYLKKAAIDGKSLAALKARFGKRVHR
jgi:uncharacterized protein (TIGR02996 family)